MARRPENPEPKQTAHPLAETKGDNEDALLEEDIVAREGVELGCTQWCTALGALN